MDLLKKKLKKQFNSCNQIRDLAGNIDFTDDSARVRQNILGSINDDSTSILKNTNASNCREIINFFERKIMDFLEYSQETQSSLLTNMSSMVKFDKLPSSEQTRFLKRDYMDEIMNKYDVARKHAQEMADYNAANPKEYPNLYDLCLFGKTIVNS